MATLNSNQLAELRQKFANLLFVVSWNKTQANSLFQALEDWYEGEKPAVSTIINTATFPVVLTNNQKKLAAAVFLIQKSMRELL